MTKKYLVRLTNFARPKLVLNEVKTCLKVLINNCPVENRFSKPNPALNYDINLHTHPDVRKNRQKQGHTSLRIRHNVL